MHVGGGGAAGRVLVAGLCAAFAALVFTYSSQAAEASDSSVRITYAEPLQLTWASTGSGTANKPGEARASFDAHGQRFELALAPNDRLTAVAPGTSLRLFRGTLDGTANSWVRLGVQGPTVSGMIWNGSELFIVEPTRSVAAFMPPLDTAAGNVVFRLRDTVLEAGALSCGAESSRQLENGTFVYETLLRELKRGAPAQTLGATSRLQVSAIADSLLRQRFGSEADTRSEILIRMNNVDGIYSSQIGVEIQMPTIDVRDPAQDPFSPTTVPASLLDELAQLRRNSAALRSAGLTHLFTGRNLDGTTVGIAYIDTLCSQKFGAGLTEVRDRSTFLDSLITAHEIGHNFGAVHDGEGTCPSNPNHLMSSDVTVSNTTFSQCSLDAIVPRSRSATCITGLAPPDLAVAQDLGTTHHPVGRPFELTVDVVNVGGMATVASRAELLVPPSVAIDDAFVAGGTCTSGAGAIACIMGDIPGGAKSVIHLVLRSDAVGSNSLSARVTASNDTTTTDNQGDGTIVIDPEADLGIAFGSSGSMPVGQSYPGNFTVTNAGTMSAGNIVVTIDIPASVDATASLQGGSCTSIAGRLECRAPLLAAGASTTGTLRLTGRAPGAITLHARVAGDYFDPSSANNLAVFNIEFTPTASEAAGSGGGGGSPSPLLLIVLGSLAALRRLGERPKPPAGSH
jgi:hypothetical protein